MKKTPIVAVPAPSVERDNPYLRAPYRLSSGASLSEKRDHICNIIRSGKTVFVFQIHPGEALTRVLDARIEGTVLEIKAGTSWRTVDDTITNQIPYHGSTGYHLWPTEAVIEAIQPQVARHNGPPQPAGTKYPFAA